MNKESQKVLLFLNDYFDGNITRCAKSLDIDKSTISRIVNQKTNAGMKVMTRIIKYCDERNYKHENYVSFRK